MKNRIKKYFNTRSKWSIAGDALFILLIILLLIPGPRRVIISNVQRLIAGQPKELSSPITLSNSDYQWSFADLEGNVVHFEELKGKVVLLNLWATWCPPCLAEFPSLEKLHDDYKDKVAFVFLTNENPETVSLFMSKRNSSLPVFIPLSSLPKLLDSSTIPHTVILGKDGKIYVEHTGAAKWDGRKTRSLMDRLINESD